MDILNEIAETKKDLLPSFAKQIRRKGIIAEVKRKSPSAGSIADFDALEQARKYSGAAAISVLTDQAYFGGSVEDLSKVREGVLQPVLRKDFIVDPHQLMEVKASCVLLIVALLRHDLERFLKITDSLGIDALVEVHDEIELQIAIDAGAKIIGINNRNLKTFHVDFETCKRLLPKIPRGVLKVAESGIQTIEQARELFDRGFDALLIGETLVKAKDPERLIQLMKRRVKICGVKDPDTAHFAASHGADYIGLVFDKNSKRNIDVAMAKKVAESAREGGAIPVAVFVDQDADQMKAILDETGITFAQLHGEKACSEHIHLPEDVTRIFEVRFGPHGLDPHRDYLLYDNSTPGSGKTFDWDAFSPKPDFPYFIAGGINSENISEAKQKLNPDVIDVSSGVEGPNGKDKHLIEELLKQC
ncbi:MAG: Tryptophan biosynthesis protein TrpCF [Chlamydiia bacterium]|nr:Tryptophan biosynthesis protein TrpCF [Chlamydiia bacterium]MCH9615735.1 Tryptophan biosynthesis protein TrpCF [Chlamydiia bacterium]MCH9628862.1 Tryptophan biosynthesis protein TrpCF [Chlamydiia bacterium]